MLIFDLYIFQENGYIVVNYIDDIHNKTTILSNTNVYVSDGKYHTVRYFVDISHKESLTVDGDKKMQDVESN